MTLNDDLFVTRMKDLVERMEETAKMMESIGETREEMKSVLKMEEIVRSMEAGARAEIMMPVLEGMEASLEKNIVKRVQEATARTEQENASAPSSLHSLCYKLRRIEHSQLDSLLANRYYSHRS